MSSNRLYKLSFEKGITKKLLNPGLVMKRAFKSPNVRSVFSLGLI